MTPTPEAVTLEALPWLNVERLAECMGLTQSWRNPIIWKTDDGDCYRTEQLESIVSALKAADAQAYCRANAGERGGDGPGVEDGPWAEGWQDRCGITEERDALLYELADLHDSIRTIYIGQPGRAFADECEAALIGVCYLMTLHGIAMPKDCNAPTLLAGAAADGRGGG